MGKKKTCTFKVIVAHLINPHHYQNSNNLGSDLTTYHKDLLLFKMQPRSPRGKSSKRPKPPHQPVHL